MALAARALRSRFTAFHPEAHDWRNRVLSNGGTVSNAQTMNAISRFCYEIDAARLRDRFVRLSLMAGSDLNACLVPLYRGPSRTGTQYGNTTDTNNGPFVSGDYAETGASGGLTGNGSSKYLNTGLAMNTIGTTGHVAAYLSTYVSQNAFFIGARDSRDWYAIRTWGGNAIQGYYGLSDGEVLSLSSTSPAFYLVTRSNAGTPSISNAASEMYRNGTSVVTDSGVGSGIVSHSNQHFVFCVNYSGSPSSHSSARLGGYSLGLSMTASQASAYYNAMQNFQTALSRNV